MNTVNLGLIRIKKGVGHVHRRSLTTMKGREGIRLITHNDQHNDAIAEVEDFRAGVTT